ncbi:NarL family two-component system response regulator LiaR [Symbiobacterium terraclitae]|uniref:Stage 0 sporulation protein A homolog n=1 Tax=Symbiobacterium terraclitae TaxID=557451 RepID=A0ABS4JQR3_9FIRM|nr:response regulator transcription factor [Symbiobacterium terraclitae]MBP2017876.1 NarL family two-component system response regulator LiaR [Symbiobacterium terraclitae]
MIRLLIVDDHKMVREGLKIYLSTEPEIHVVGEAENGEEAARLAAELRPDVILMDLIMPGVDGIEGTKRCLAACPETRVIVLTSMPDDELVVPAIRAGALSYILKDISADELAETIKKAVSGKPTLHPVAAQRMMQELTAPPKPRPGVDEISPREMEVLRLIAQGLSNKEIGDRLFIGERTVKTHVSHLLEKLQLQDRTQLAIYALQNKLV